MTYVGKSPADIIATAVDTTTGTFSGDLTVDTSTLYVDSANNRIGVGLTNPSSKLQVLGGTSGLDQISLSSNLTSNTVKYAGVIMTNYANTTTALLGAKAESGSTSIYYGSSGTDHRGPQNHIFYTNVSPTATSGNTKRMQIGNNGDILLGYEDTGTTPKLFWDASAESLGIGTTTPSQKVESSSATNNIINSKTTLSTALGGFTAYGNSTSHIKMFQFGSAYGGTAFAGLTGNNQAIIEAQEASSLVISTQGGTPDIVFAPARTARMTITNGGNVGIGTSPTDILHIKDSSSTNVLIDAPTDNATLTLQCGSSDAGAEGAFINFIQNTTSKWQMGMNTDNTFRWYNYNTSSEAMRIDSNGNVGIGTTSPDTNLDIERSSNDTGGIKVQNTNNSQGSAVAQVEISGGDNAYANLLLECNSTNHSIRQDGSGNLKFINASTERMRITSVGTTEFYQNVGNSTTASLYHSDATSPYGIYMKFTGGVIDNNIHYFFAAEDSAATTRVVIYSDGDIYNHDGTFAQISDRRIKDNITDANSQWDDIKAMRFVNYQRKDDIRQYGESEAKVQLGLIGQELEAVSPNLVRSVDPSAGDIISSSEFGSLYVEGDDIPEGKQVGDVKEVTDKVKGVAYSILYLKAVKALQEAMIRIETLETANTALEARIEALENA